MGTTDFFPKVRSYEELYHLANKSIPQHSFFGSRYITIEGCQRELSLDTLTERLLQLVNKNTEFSEVERKYGKLIAKKINWIYEKSDKQVMSSNFLTRILVYLNDILFYIFPKNRHLSWAKWSWQVGFDDSVFEYYTRNQFQKAFWISPEVAKESGWDLGFRTSGSTPERWRVYMAKELSLFDLLKTITYRVFLQRNDINTWIHLR